MHEQGDQLIEPHALAPPRLQRVLLVIRGEHALREAPEQEHHREVHLAVATHRRGVHKHGGTALVGHAVARPQVAVQPRGRLDGARQIGQPGEDAVEHPA